MQIVGLAIAASCLTACATGLFDNTPSNCPPWPEAGDRVAEELEAVPFEGFEDFWEWMSRLDKLRDQLDACR